MFADFGNQLTLGEAVSSGSAKPQMSKHQKVRGKKHMIIMLTLTHPSSMHPSDYPVIHVFMRGADLGTSGGLAPILQYKAEICMLRRACSLPTSPILEAEVPGTGPGFPRFTFCMQVCLVAHEPGLKELQRGTLFRCYPKYLTMRRQRS